MGEVRTGPRACPSRTCPRRGGGGNDLRSRLLGAILEKVAGKSYAELIQERIAEPLGLTSLRYGSHADIIPNRPAGYAGPKHEWRNADFLSMSQPYSAGGLLCSIDDLERWTVALHEGRVVSRKSLQLMLRPTYIGDREAPYGFGLGMGQVRGRQAYGHGGGIPGCPGKPGCPPCGGMPGCPMPMPPLDGVTGAAGPAA